MGLLEANSTTMKSKKETFFNGISVQTVITFLMGIMEILVFSVMSRLLTKTDFGYFAVLTGVMTICTSITEAGMGAAIIQKKDASKVFISTAFTLSWIFGLISTIIVFVFAPYLAECIADNSLTLPLRIMSINIFLACISSVGRSLMLKKLQFKRVGQYNIIAYFISSICGISMAFLGYGLYAIVSISIINLIIFNVLIYKSGITFPKWTFSKKDCKQIFSFGSWLTLSVIINNITQQLDKLLLTKWLSVTILGAYNRPAGFIANITNRINGIFDTVLFPMLSDIQHDLGKTRNIFLRSIKLLNSCSAVLFAVFFFNAHLIITVFFGTKWIELVPILQIISISVIFSIDNRLVDCYFRSLNLVYLGFKLRVFSAILTLVCIIIGTKYALYGVAYGLLMANLVTVFIKVYFLAIFLNVRFIDFFKSCVIAFKPIIPLMFVGGIFLTCEFTVWKDVAFACVFAILVILEFFFFPNMVGSEYEETIYPIIKGKLLKGRE